MNTQITTLLQCTPHQLEMTVFNHFQWWCELYAFSNQDLQRLLSNATVNRWFLKEYTKYQKSFLEKATPYFGLGDAQAMYDLYKQETRKIQYYYPRAIIYSVRKKTNNIYGQTTAN